MTIGTGTPDVGTNIYPNLFSPIMVGPIQLKNRITMLPMGTRIPTDGIVNDADIAWHEERARGGVGLIVAGGHIVHPTSLMRGHFNGLIEAFNEAGLENQQRKVSAVHKYGVKSSPRASTWDEI